MTPKIDRPSLESASGRQARHLRELTRGPGQWVYVGTFPGDADTVPESVPFKNGYSNGGAGFARCRFRINKWREVEIEGAPTGGTPGLPMFTLPAAYRPDVSLRFACAADASSVTTAVQVDPTGDVIQVS